MTADTKKRGLGRGLDALFRDAKNEEDAFAPVRRADEIVTRAPSGPSSAAGGGVRKIGIEKLRPGAFQPRKIFDDAALEELAASIAVHGVLQPLLVRAANDGVFEIIAGERRWRAAQKARLHDVPVVVLDLDDKRALEVALIENLQRDDLSALEEAEGFQRLMDEFRHTQEELAVRLGKSRSHITNTLRLLKLSARIKKYIQDGKLSAGHARALVGHARAEELADVIIKRGLNVRQTERLIQGAGGARTAAKTAGKAAGKALVFKDVDVLALEEKVSSLLGLKVLIESQGAGGTLHIAYASLDQLDDVLERLSQAPHRG